MAVLAVSSITSNSRFGYGGSCKIFDWTVGLNGGEQTMITCFDDLATDAEAAHRSENLPISFVDFCIGQTNPAFPRHLFAVANSIFMVSS